MKLRSRGTFVSILWSLEWRVKPLGKEICSFRMAPYPRETVAGLAYRKLGCVV